ncbi:MAG: radical SAM protein [Candidatus Bathyarchaeia archaeon]|nr:radical SAM protein [Candidatus Bathyarchaeota archaeon A05DMB-4]MDH7595306.1 radical SAM protein [Candidatus Bathyarchaeota archaeon]
MNNNNVPELIRVSIGSAIVLGLVQGNLDAFPTTAYLLTYRTGKCTANCGFCPQARNSKSRADMLSRVTWPAFLTLQVIEGIAKAVEQDRIKRVCIQALNYPTVFDDVLCIVSNIRSKCHVPISISCQPINDDTMKKLATAGVDRIGIPLDAATREIFEKIKGKAARGPYVWEKQLETLGNAVKIFGKNNVSTHLIVGLGETEKEMAEIIQRCVDMGVFPSLFAFTPISGTTLERCLPPSLARYRRIQLARYLIVEGKSRIENMQFNGDGKIVDFGVSPDTLNTAVSSGVPFLTSGCPDCNRPYYNEKPGGPIYNYPYMPTADEIEEIAKVFKQ